MSQRFWKFLKNPFSGPLLFFNILGKFGLFLAKIDKNYQSG